MAVDAVARWEAVQAVIVVVAVDTEVVVEAMAHREDSLLAEEGEFHHIASTGTY